MRSSTWRLEDLRNVTLNIGFVGENLHTRQIFDCKKMFDQYPQASVSMTVTPPHGEPYPGSIERDGDLVIWDVTDSDLVSEGDGEIQIVFTQTPHIARSYNARTHVCRSQMPTGDVPSGLDDFITRAGNLLEEVEDTFPAGGTTGQVLAKKSNNDYDTEWVDQDGGTEDYDELQNRPQIGGVTLTGNKSLSDLGAASASDVNAKYTKPSGGIPDTDLSSGVQASLGKADSAYQKPSGGIPAEDIASGVIPSVIGKADKVSSATSGDFAGLDSNGNLTDSGKKASDFVAASDFYATEMPISTTDSSKVSELKSQITVLEPTATSGDVGKVPKVKTVADGKVSEYEFGSLPSVPVTDVQVNGTSVLSQGVANIPAGSTSDFGVFKLNQYGGLQIGSDGLLKTASASEANIKAATDTTKPIVPARQHASVFYGLAAASGDTTQSSSANAVGVYTPDALVKIQKMLGIYEAPWELIREDTFTNATEADHWIQVDGNGNQFSLTDLVLWFELPNTEAASSKGTYGQILYYYESDKYVATESGTMTRTANGAALGTMVKIEQDKHLITTTCARQTSTTNGCQLVWRYHSTSPTSNGICLVDEEIGFYRVNIKSVTGTGHYKLYGKRKWTT